jgi:two-component system, chemotaxis family, chemotaxis protein CheY
MSVETLKDIRVMIVDDVPSARRVIKKQLENLGYRDVMEAESGEDALSLLSKEPCSLILSDWNMPKLGGLELLKHLRSKESSKNLPFIMITSTAGSEQIVESAKAGVTDFIVKPFSTETLEKKISGINDKIKPIVR